MADVLLTHSNHLYFDSKQVEKMQPYPPLQTLLAAAVLEEAGIETALFDPTLTSPERFEQALEQHSPRLLVVCEDDFNFLSKMCLSRNRELGFWMAAMAKRMGIPAVVHGSDSSDHVREYLDAGFIAVLIGEVETTLLEVAQQAPWPEIRGLAFRDPRGQIQYNARRPLRTDLDSLPLPAWRLVEIEQYRKAWTAAHGYFSLNLASSRGCPYSCNWCAKPIYGSTYHARSAQSVAGEMLYVKSALAADHIWFADDIFALSAKWTEAFAEEVERLDAGLPFKMQSRCDLMTRSTVAALRRAGCAEVWMGAESGSQQILDAMEKGIRVEQIGEARENLRRHGIRACFFLQFGYPGETWSDIEQTIQMVRETKPDDVGISVSYPLPGTKFFELVSDQLGQTTNWRNSGDLAMMFRGTYSSAFYRALADAVHREVRGQSTDGELERAWSRVRALEAAESACDRVAS